MKNENDVKGISQENHKALGIALYNYVWTFLEMTERTDAENETMVNATHASRYHWGKVGTPREFSIGEWQISRVYSVLGWAEPALFHGRRALRYCEANGLGDFMLAYSYEAIARAAAVGNDAALYRATMRIANSAVEGIAEEDDRAMFVQDL